MVNAVAFVSQLSMHESIYRPGEKEAIASRRTGGTLLQAGQTTPLTESSNAHHSGTANEIRFRHQIGL